MDELDAVDVKELAIHLRVSRLNYSRRCSEASAVQAHIEAGYSIGLRYGDWLCDSRCTQVGGRSREDSIKVRRYLLSRAAGEGLGRGSICFSKDWTKPNRFKVLMVYHFPDPSQST